MTTISSLYLNKIIQGNSLTLLKQFPDQSVDLIFADPPYNLQLKNTLTRPDHSTVNAVMETWDHFNSFAEYDQFCITWLTECQRILKKTGTIWLIGTYHNIFRLGALLQNLGFWILNDIVWVKPNPMPNFRGTRFNNAHETLIWAAPHEKAKYTFHYHTMKNFNDDKQMRSDWMIPICSGIERLKENGQKVHPTQKPEALLYRILLATSNDNDIILDPFAGSGTTAVAAKQLGRQFIAIEQDPYYVEQAQLRLERTIPFSSAYFMNPEKKHAHIKVPFGALIETGLICAGEILYSPDQKETAIVQVNGSLTYHNEIESFHKLSAKLLHQETANGWDYWHFFYHDQFVPLAILREKYLEYFFKPLSD